MTFTLTPGGLAPLHYRVACCGFDEQSRLQRWVEQAWPLLMKLARELAA